MRSLAQAQRTDNNNYVDKAYYIRTYALHTLSLYISYDLIWFMIIIVQYTLHSFVHKTCRKYTLLTVYKIYNYAVLPISYIYTNIELKFICYVYV